MALTEQEKQGWFEVLKRTGAHREAGKIQRVIPDEYRAFGEQVERREELLRLPGVDVPVRCCISEAKNRTAECPVHVNMHGGGFIYPQDGDDDRYCAHVAAEIRGIVVDIDYATSDVHPFPTAFDQCYEVVRWVFAQCGAWNADPGKVSMGGHSAGGSPLGGFCI